MKRRLLSMFMVLVLGVSLFAGCSSSQSNLSDKNESVAPVSAKDTTFGIEPFSSRQELRVGYFAGSALSIPFYIADNEGFFDELNIDIKYETFTNGPGMMEANADWDVAGAGSAGVLVGQIGYDTPMIGISDYETNQGLFVRADSPIAKDPDNPENWKGTTWLYPVGTTAHFTLSTMLGKLGLDDSDIKSINMDVSSALNAFIGGEGDGLAVWNAFAFRAEDEGFVRVADAGTLDIVNSSGTVATKDALENKRELLKKSFAVFYKTVEWINENEENKEKAIKYYLESAEDEGIAVDRKIAEGIIDYFKCPGLDESIKLMTETSKDPKGLYTDRELLQAEIDLLVTMDFFIEQGKFKPEDRVKILSQKLVDPSIATEVKAMLK
ncbi:ABC transporter substrate-binding protein [Petroclostridium sp. X23]|uniref:ABC transporter substrate-binding protein n=1 Tax=Petroclostridium sp. X23 TaxID=3045146 RepID=UPI0024AE12B8|nr:ABC transporter substrate-binding protein [Petroclostridium sp. X23]WHH60941.1 ABC transporter substrate-binding protein [Petroclostridium sp. X23]